MNQRMNADGLNAFLADQHAKIGAAFREIEELQKEYQGAYTRFKTDHDKTLLALVNRIESQPEGLSAVLEQSIDTQTDVERQDIADRIAALEKDSIPALQKKADDLLTAAQKDMAKLRAANPQLNDKEERLKQDRATLHSKFDALNDQVKQSGGGLGFILNAGKIHQLNLQRYKTLGRLQGLDEQIAQVRKEWKTLQDTVMQEEADLSSQWQAATTQLGQVRQEHDYLAANAEAEARHRAIVTVIDNMKALPAGVNDDSLKQMVGLNIQTDDYQAALGSVAGILGVLKGVEEGLNRIGESVKALYSEQQLHSQYLPALQFELTDRVLAFGKTWDDLIDKSKDDKTLAKHPADYVTALKPFLEERLSKEPIASFFGDLGQALQRASASWSRK